MLVRDVIAQVPEARLAVSPARDGRDAVVGGFSHDPMRVGLGDLFFCLNERTRDNPFASLAAVARGASAVLCEPGTIVPPHAPRIEVRDAGAAFVQAAAADFGHPARSLSSVAVECATAGPGETRCAATNVAWLLTRLMRLAGANTALVGEPACEAGGREIPLAASRPDAFELQRLPEAHRHAGGSGCRLRHRGRSGRVRAGNAAARFRAGCFPRKFILEADRARAIDRAIRAARANDVVLLAGKGHRRTQEMDGTVEPFHEAAHAVEALALRGFGGDL
jgi:UDP-N-acetylmuramyl tripeptide synthase